MGRYSGRSFRLIVMCVVSILLFVLELVVAHIGNSLSLASDAFAVLSHVLSMIIGVFGVRASHISQHRKSTFGFLRADVVGAFGNSIFAVALMFSILVEAIKRYISPQKTEEALLVLSAGVIGLFFNLLNYVIFLDCCYCSGSKPRRNTEADRKDFRFIVPYVVHKGSVLEFSAVFLRTYWYATLLAVAFRVTIHLSKLPCTSSMKLKANI
ncbi:hypothetical protein STEG23_030141 [Scotinomys teguina]